MPTIKRNNTGKVETGKRAVATSIMRAAERGALKEDVRAARAGLITPITRPRGKLTATTARHQPTGEWKRIQAEQAEERALARRAAAYERKVYEAILAGRDHTTIEF